MEHGLCIVQIQITYYRVITFVGWARRKRGDEWELVPGARIITRKSGQNVSWNGFDDLAADGPGTKYKLYPPMRKAEPLHRILIKRCKEAEVSAWIEHVPKPDGWRDEP